MTRPQLDFANDAKRRMHVTIDLFLSLSSLCDWGACICRMRRH